MLADCGYPRKYDFGYLSDPSLSISPIKYLLIEYTYAITILNDMHGNYKVHYIKIYDVIISFYTLLHNDYTIFVQLLFLHI